MEINSSGLDAQQHILGFIGLNEKSIINKPAPGTSTLLCKHSDGVMHAVSPALSKTYCTMLFCREFRHISYN